MDTKPELFKEFPKFIQFLVCRCYATKRCQRLNSECPQEVARARTLSDIKEWLSAAEVYKLITNKTWPYKVNMKYYYARDKALMAIDFVGAFRNNEPLKVLKKSSFEDTPAWLILRGGKISKRSKKLLARHGARITVRSNISFPKFTHPLQPFTDLVLDYLAMLEPDSVLFRFRERRHHQIVMQATDKWVHWLRAMGENWYGHNVFINDPVSLAKFIGVVNVQSVMPYTAFDEASYLERMKLASTHDRKWI